MSIMKASRKTYIDMLKKLKPSKSIVAALEKFDRADFVDPLFHESVYKDECVPIGAGERTEMPSTLVRMIGHAEITKKARILEIGTGSGYSTALLAEISHEVISIEIRQELAERAKVRHERLRIRNSRFFAGDGIETGEELGLFDAIFVWGACFARPLLLASLLKPNGKMVFPMGPAHQQQIAVYSNDADNPRTRFHEFCFFPPIQGRYGTEIMHRDTVMANFSLEEETENNS
jgi:protein-L-isoaspartate(D-aspartate) O-methyltransferase